MIEYLIGDIFSSPAQVIVNTVNTVGVMGKGLALSYKERYPDMFNVYRQVCEKGQFEIGKLMLWNAPDHWILLFPTKENWRNPSKLEYIKKGLEKFAKTYDKKGITSIAFPRLGCGNGELNWDEVKPLMEQYLSPLPIDIYIYVGVENNEIPESKSPKKTVQWMKENARDLSFNSVKEEIMHITALAPYMLNYKDKSCEIQWREKDLIISTDNKELYSVNDDKFFQLWNDMRNKGIFQDAVDNEMHNVVYALLESLGYSTKIKIFDSKSKRFIQGYQMNEGADRAFALKGA